MHSTIAPSASVALWIVDLSDDAWPTEIPTGILDESEEARASRFHFTVHRNRFRRRRFAYRDILANACGCRATELAFATGRLGKPSLSSPRANIAFNTSHSADLALLAVTEDRPLGVDIELVRPEIIEPVLLARVLTERERLALDGLPATQQAHAFFTAWARKEAYAKGIGIGLTLDVGIIDVAPTEPSPPPIRNEGDSWSLVDVMVDPQYRSAVAVPAAGVHVSTKLWSRSMSRVIG